MPTIAENQQSWGDSYDWKDRGDEWSAGWGSTSMMWYGSILPRIARFLPCERLLEIAPGFGRVTAFLLPQTKSYIGVDLAARCVEACRKRFAGTAHTTFTVGNGRSLEMVPSASMDFAFSWDSLVHADAVAMNAYVAELARVLRPGGSAFLHHSNCAALEPSSPAVAVARSRWRDMTVSARLMREWAAAAAISCVAQELVPWACSDLSDCFTLLRKPLAGEPLAPATAMAFRRDWEHESSHFALLDSLYGPTPHSAAAHQRRAHAFERAGDLDAALREMEQALAQHPDAKDLAMHAAWLLRAQKHFDRAEQLLAAAIAASPAEAGLWVERAWLRLDQGRQAEALAEAKRAESLLTGDTDGRAPSVYHALSVTHGTAGHLQQALQYVDRAVSLRVGDASLLVCRAHIRQGLGDLARAREDAASALRIEPQNQSALAILNAR